MADLRRSPAARPAVGLKDVAARAGVSVKTVSNVVNDFPHVAPSTRERVRAALDELNYRPNLAARNLRRGRSGLIALALPELDIPYFAELARLVVEAADAHGLTVLVEQTGGIRAREQLFVSGVRAQLIDALILTPLALTRSDLAAREDTVPLVLLGESVADGRIDQVSIDSVKAGVAATEHLLGLGRRRIAAIGNPLGPARSTAHLRRLRGYRRALAAAGVDADPRLVPRIHAFHPTEGERAMGELLALPEPPDAVFCFNDLLALGAVRRLLTSGRRVPEDVAVAGFDDIEEATYTTPTLTTISPDKAAIARLAVDRVLAQLGRRATRPARRTEVGFSLIARESTLGPAAPARTYPVMTTTDEETG